MATHTPESESLFSAISAFLADSRQARDTEPQQGYWQARPRITACEIDVLMALCEQSLCLDTIAGMLGRDCESARDFADALVSVGLLERCSGRYAATTATALYCHALREGHLPPSP
jgi:hypothetical protein